MRFYLEALRHLASSKIAVFSAAALVSTLALAGVVSVWPVEEEVPADTVTVSGPIFTPVTLTPPVPIPAINPNRPGETFAAPSDNTSLTRGVQRLLKRARCYGGAVDGIWNVQTRRGMAEFTRLVNARLPLDKPAPELLSLLELNDDIVCPSGCAGGAVENCPPAPVPKREETASIEKAPEHETNAAVEPPASGAPQTASTEIPDDTVRAVPAPVPAVQKPPHRKYKKNSFSRAVSKGFRQIQRTFNSLF